MAKRTIVQGIYQDAHGISVIARIGSGRQLREASVRFPLVDEDGVPYSKKNSSELIKCRLQLLEDLRRTRATDGTGAGTLGAAIDQWLADHPVPPGTRLYEEYRGLLPHWRALPLAALPVTAVKRSAIRAQLAQWTEAGLAPSTVNHRKRVLADVLRHALGADDDPDVIVPTAGIAKVPEKDPEPRGVPLPILARILSHMPDTGRARRGAKRPTVSETKIRLSVMVWTGLAHASLTRLDRRRVNFRTGQLFLPPRQKGKGAAGIWMDLLPPALEALRQYDRAGLWGRPFSRSSMHKSWRRAIAATRAQLQQDAEQSGDRTLVEQFVESVPADCHPYDSRHSFLTDAYLQTGGDILAVKAIGQHASVTTTERYTKSAVPAQVAAAIGKMRARWFPEAKPAGVVRDFQIVKGER